MAIPQKEREVCVCVCACVNACVHACVCGHGCTCNHQPKVDSFPSVHPFPPSHCSSFFGSVLHWCCNTPQCKIHSPSLLTWPPPPLLPAPTPNTHTHPSFPLTHLRLAPPSPHSYISWEGVSDTNFLRWACSSTVQICWSVYCSKGSRFILSDPENSTGSCKVGQRSTAPWNATAMYFLFVIRRNPWYKSRPEVDTLVNVSLNATVCISSSHEKYRKYNAFRTFQVELCYTFWGEVWWGWGVEGGWGVKTNLMVKATHS